MLPIRASVPTRFPAVANYVFIGINVLVFLFQISLPAQEQQAFTYLYGLVPARYSEPTWAMRIGFEPGDYWPFVTAMFLHGGWLHLILNMWTLWLFGAAVEDRLGSARYVIFYLACGLAGNLGHYWFNLESRVPVVGASGAIAGVTGAFVVLYPLARIIVLVPIIFIPLFFPLPAILYIGFWFVMQLAQGTLAELTPSSGGVAWWAHIAGFGAGVVLVFLLKQPERTYRPYYGDEGVLGFGTRGR